MICVSVAGPALVELGLAPLQAHLFVFRYALFCTIMPTVCRVISRGLVRRQPPAPRALAVASGAALVLWPA